MEWYKVEGHQSYLTMAIAQQEKPARIHPREIFSLQERKEEEDANNRVEKLLFDYIYRHVNRLQQWIDQGKSAD